jgi:hypothetical protein
MDAASFKKSPHTVLLVVLGKALEDADVDGGARGVVAIRPWDLSERMDLFISSAPE